MNDNEDEEEEDDKIVCEEKDTPRRVCIPLQFDVGLCETDDCCRAWSCIILAYLLNDAMLSLSDNSADALSNEANGKDGQNYRNRHLFKQRGRYFTGREKKYCWQTLKNVTNVF